MGRGAVPTSHGDQVGAVPAAHAQGPGSRHQVEVGHKIGQVAEQERPGENEENGILQRGEVQERLSRFLFGSCEGFVAPPGLSGCF